MISGMSQRDKELLCLLLALIIVASAYMFGTRPLNEKTEELNAQAEQMQAQVDSRMKIVAAQDDYIAKTTEYNGAYDEMMVRYPAGISQDDQIMFAQDLQNLFDYPMESVNFTNPENSAALTTTADTGNPYMLEKSTLQIPVQLAYPDWISFISYLGDDARGKNVLTNIEGTYDPETNIVSSTVSVDQYAIIGDDRPFEAEQGSSLLGTNNIFVTGEGGTSVEFMDDEEEEEVNFVEVRDNFNLYVMLYPFGEGDETVFAGAADDSSMDSVNLDDMIDLEIHVYDSDDGNSTTISYVLGDGEVQEVTGIEDNAIRIYVYSSARVDDADSSGVYAYIYNESSKQLRLGVEHDDEDNPRFNIMDQEGDMEYYLH